jgi:hypothetical protein
MPSAAGFAAAAAGFLVKNFVMSIRTRQDRQERAPKRARENAIALRRAERSREKERARARTSDSRVEELAVESDRDQVAGA